MTESANDELHAFLQRAVRSQYSVISEKSSVASNEQPATSIEHPASGIQPLVIFIDQFEEFFIVFENKQEARRKFIEQVAKIKYDDSLPVFLVLSLREDYFANLYEFRDAIPSIFQNNASLGNFTDEEARRAIIKPLEAVGAEIEGGRDGALVETLLRDLKNGKPGIEPIKLQIVCDTVWRKKPANATQITGADYQAAGGAKYILTNLTNYVSRLLNDLPRRQQRLMAKIFEALKTPDDTKRYRSFSDLRENLKIGAGSLQAALQQLAGLNLLRHEERAGDHWYEFKHDYLVAEVAAWLQARRERIAKRRLWYGLAPGVALLLGLLVYLFIQYNSFYAGIVTPENVGVQEDEIAIFRNNPFHQVVVTTGYRLSQARNDSTRKAFKNHFNLGFRKNNDWVWLASKLNKAEEGKFLYRLGKAQIALDTLVAALKDQESTVRSQAAAALGNLGQSDDRVISALVAALKDQDNYVRDEAAAALGNLGQSDDRVISALLAALKDQSYSVRTWAAAALGNLGQSDDRVISALLAALKDQESYVRTQAAAALGNLGQSDDRVISALLAALKDQWYSVRAQAAAALGNLGQSDDRVISALLAALKDQNSTVRYQAAAALGNLFKTKREPELLALLANNFSGYRTAGAQALARQDFLPPALSDKIDQLKENDRPWVRLAAWEADELIQARSKSEAKARKLLR
ncbi:MAG: HEAT repeat domain-containing protein [candidate division KSB1 bacterium]|nr:HEAT repeat domain-containing protein [candidate division KSB1 bacterium]MDZ7406974.1 HEAT repeat domain-containing protein [candidate division KSB1 bacterium]